MYLLLLAIAPAAALMRYVWKQDKSKEPGKMLAMLVFLGVISCFPAGEINALTEQFYSSIFIKDSMIYNFFYYFLGVALTEEGLKFIFMFLYTRKHKEFNGLFDGMIYAIFVSLGFAAFENITYVIEGGVTTAIMRAVLSVPGHMFFAVFMGYYYSMWHTYKLCDASEKYFANLGMITPRPPKYKYKGYLALAIIVPVLIHGFYDFCLSANEDLFYLAALALMVALYFVCFARIKKLSKNDLQDYQLIPMLLCKKYPELIGIIIPRQANPMTVDDSYYQQRMPANNYQYARAGVNSQTQQRPVNRGAYAPNYNQQGTPLNYGNSQYQKPNQGYPNTPGNYPKGNNQNNNYR